MSDTVSAIIYSAHVSHLFAFCSCVHIRCSFYFSMLITLGRNRPMAILWKRKENPNFVVVFSFSIHKTNLLVGYNSLLILFVDK